MNMNRRDFLTGISVVGVPAILLPGVVLDAVEGSEDPSLCLAAKARKLVDYVVTQKDHPRVRDYSHNPDPRTTLVQIDEGEFTYTISISKSISKKPYDRLSIRFEQIENRPFGSSALVDENLDGILEHGFIGRGVSSLLPPEIQRLNRFADTEYSDIAVMHVPPTDLSKPNWGTELFQKLYEHTLDTLIGVYEKQP